MLQKVVEGYDVCTKGDMTMTDTYDTYIDDIYRFNEFSKLLGRTHMRLNRTLMKTIRCWRPRSRIFYYIFKCICYCTYVLKFPYDLIHFVRTYTVGILPLYLSLWTMKLRCTRLVFFFIASREPWKYSSDLPNRSQL